ncbi:MAG TPA: hypothetical protein VK694_05920 [Verrucomicrobiae bacterium]|nr:hypothetical protein [Verrucomicrobiae bacterium]
MKRKAKDMGADAKETVQNAGNKVENIKDKAGNRLEEVRDKSDQADADGGDTKVEQ